MKASTSRRSALKTGCAAGIAGALYTANFGRGIQAAVNNMPLSSSPSDLKITDMKWGLSYGIGYELYVKIYTNQNITGLGTGTDPAGNAGFNMLRRFKGLLVGQNPLDVNRLFEKIRRSGHCFGGQGGVYLAALAAIEIALWDIAGKALGVPVYRLLGGKFRDRIRIYRDIGTSSPSKSPDEIVAAGLDSIKQGFTAMKFDFDWGGDPRKRDEFNMNASNAEIERMVEHTAALRDAVGNQIDICMDCHGSFNLTSALKIAKAIEPFDVMFLEEPIPAENKDALREITSSTSTPICVGENLYHAHDYRELFEIGALDVVMPDLNQCGGLGEGQRIANLAHLYYIPVAPHMVGSPLGMMASAHCCASIPNFLVLEWHWDQHLELWNAIAPTDQPLIQDGYVTIPDRPGIGLDIDEDVLRANKVEDYPFFE